MPWLTYPFHSHSFYILYHTAIISGDNSKGYAFIELKLSKPPTPRQTATKEKKVRKWKKKNKADKSETEEDYNEDYEEGVATVEDEDADIENQY